MILKKILKDLNYELISGSLNIKIKDIKYDSRKVKKGDIFIALKGLTKDGHDYIPEAISKGASAIIISKMITIYGNTTIIKVDDDRKSLALISKNYFDSPNEKLYIIGVTGTTGKTTTTHIIYDILNDNGIKCGLIGSIGIKYNNKNISTDNTTPESYEIYKSFYNMLKSGITHVVMECSSQAFKMQRLAGITFDLGVLTNITSDHISPKEHKNHQEYVSCKKELLINSKKIIINNDSKYLKEILKNVNTPKITYALKNNADIEATNIKLINNDSFIGSEFTTLGLINDTFKTNLPGLFNIYNVLCALTVINELSIDLKKIKKSLINTKVNGRMETVLANQNYKVIIDYAHTLDGMKELVKTLKAYHPKRLISIFGSGGNRSKERRYSLGKILGKASDLCIITMDNPRFEEVSSINNDIKVGLKEVNAKFIEIEDREKAIIYAINNAKTGDLILLLGKGHEEYQEIKGIKYYFNEHKIIAKLKKLTQI